MAIYLDQQTRPYLEKLIETRQDWIAERIKEALKADRDRLDGIAQCEHEFAEFVGKKECCKKCGAYDVGMGESWTLKEFYEQNKK